MSTKKILIIEDEDEIAKALKMINGGEIFGVHHQRAALIMLSNSIFIRV